MTTEERLSRLEGAYEHVATKADVQEIKTAIISVEGRVSGIEGRLDRIESRLDKLIFTLFGAGIAFGVSMAVLLVRSFATG